MSILKDMRSRLLLNFCNTSVSMYAISVLKQKFLRKEDHSLSEFLEVNDSCIDCLWKYGLVLVYNHYMLYREKDKTCNKFSITIDELDRIIDYIPLLYDELKIPIGYKINLSLIIKKFLK